MKRFLIGASVALLGMGSIASAATLDFVAEAAIAERGVADGTTIANMGGSGIDVTLSANGSNSAYLDGVSGGRPAGLGVCSILNASAQCNPSNDDNITSGEEVFIQVAALGQAASGGTLGSASFYDANHYNDRWATDATFDYSLDGGLNWVTAALAATYDFGAASFTAAGLGFRYTNTQFYVGSLGNAVVNQVSAVPLPAGGMLLLTAFGGLAFARRRKLG